ncbi:SRPBCC family protein [Leucobacter sp. 7(1)]|uniref:SRPBCC family protein n=1 Tax=Leucobacter sp. 7(1) TaxID=1255613 RepID=UPI000B35A4F0
MMPTISSDIDINLPVRTVYNQWTQFETYPAFMTGVEAVRQLDDTHLSWDVAVGGAERGFETEITEQIPDERIAWRSTDGPTHAGVVTFHHLEPEKTRVRVQLEWEPEGFVETMGAVFQLDDAQVASDLREFARLMETQGFATGAWRGRV